jgi:hypothetical protein
LELFYLRHQKNAAAEAKTENQSQQAQQQAHELFTQFTRWEDTYHATYSWSQLKPTSYRLPPSHPNPLCLKNVIVFVLMN